MNKSDSLHHKLKTHLPSTVFEKVTDFIKKAQLSQHAKSMKRFGNAKTYSHEPATSRKQKNLHGGKRNVIPHYMKQRTDSEELSHMDHTKLKKDDQAKGLKFAITPQQLPIVNLLTETQKQANISC